MDQEYPNLMVYYCLFSTDDALDELGWGFWGIICILMLYSLQKVCDIYINYNLPLVVLFPPGIFYLALLSLDSSILNQLCYIMHRYKAFLLFFVLVHYNFIFIFKLYNKL